MPSVSVEDIVNKAFRLTGKYSVDFPPRPGDISEGIEYLNDIISADPTGVDIPFYTNVEFSLTPGKSAYTFGKIPEADFQSNRVVQIAFANLIYSGVTIPLMVFTPSQFYEQRRLVNDAHLNANAFPYCVYLQGSNRLSTIHFYYPPMDSYSVNMQLKVALDDFIPQSVMVNVPDYYHMYLQFALAKHICMMRAMSDNWTQEKENSYQKYLNEMRAGNAVDITIKTSDETAQWGGRNIYGF